MELSVSFPHESTTTNRSLKIFNSIGQGKFSVFHAYCPSLKTNYALKAFPKNSIGEAHYIKEAILASLSHHNIIKHTAINIEDSENLHFYAMLTEFSKYENFLELVLGGVINSEILVRTYFHQLISGLEYMHSQGVAHLDLKLDNLMLGSDFNLKIIDFDQAQKTTDNELTSAGTEGFRAPEVINGSCRNFCAADIYSAGVALYALATQEYPFREIKNDKKISLEHYSTFIRNNQAFWELKAAQKKDDAIFSQSFKELVNGMLEYQSEKRFTLEDIKKSNWFNGPVLEGETLKKEMKKRWESYFSAKRSEFCD